MDGNSDGYPDEIPNIELRSALNTIEYLKNDIKKITDKLSKTRQIILDDTVSIAEKKKIVKIDIHIENIGDSMNRLAMMSMYG